MAKKLTDDEMLNKLQVWFRTAEELSWSVRQNNSRDRAYYEGDQWTDQELQIMRERNQPPIVVNRIKPKIDTLVGLEKATRTDPKAVPRNPSDDTTAAAATDALRFIASNSNFDDVKSEAFEYMCVEGTAVAKITVVPFRNEDGIMDFEIIPVHIPYDRIFIDPHARMKDAADAKYIGEVVWMEMDEAMERWPNKTEELEAARLHSVDNTVNAIFSDFPNGTTKFGSSERSNQSLWFDKENNRVRVIEMWYRMGKDVFSAVFTQGVWIQKPKKSPFLDERGNTETPYVVRSATIKRKTGDRIGYVRQLVDVQDEIN